MKKQPSGYALERVPSQQHAPVPPRHPLPKDLARPLSHPNPNILPPSAQSLATRNEQLIQTVIALRSEVATLKRSIHLLNTKYIESNIPKKIAVEKSTQTSPDIRRTPRKQKTIDTQTSAEKLQDNPAVKRVKKKLQDWAREDSPKQEEEVAKRHSLSTLQDSVVASKSNKQAAASSMKEAILASQVSDTQGVSQSQSNANSRRRVAASGFQFYKML